MALKLSDLINLGTGIGSSLTNRNAYGDAAKTFGAGIDAAKTSLGDSLGRQRDLFNPYIQAGNTGINRLTELAMNPQQFGKTFQAPAVNPSALYTKDFNYQSPTGDDVRNMPGYQFGMDEGLKGIQRFAAASGGTGSSATGKALARYGTDYGTTKFNELDDRNFQRALTDYGLDKDLFQGNEAIKYGQGVDAYGRAANEFDRERSIFGENADRENANVNNLVQFGSGAAGDLSNAEGRYGDQLADLEQARADYEAGAGLAKGAEMSDLISGLGEFGSNVADDSGLSIGGLVDKVKGMFGGSLPAGFVGKDGTLSPQGIASLSELQRIAQGASGAGGGIAGGLIGPTMASPASLGALQAGIVPGMETIGPALAGPGATAPAATVPGALGSIGTLGGLVPLAAGIPIIGAGLAIGAKLLINSQAHRQADKLTGEGGIQSNLNKDLEQLAISVGRGEMSQQDADPLRQQTFKGWAEKALEFASQGSNQKKVVDQMLTSYDWDPALRALAAEYRSKLNSATTWAGRQGS